MVLISLHAYALVLLYRVPRLRFDCRLLHLEKRKTMSLFFKNLPTFDIDVFWSQENCLQKIKNKTLFVFIQVTLIHAQMGRVREGWFKPAADPKYTSWRGSGYFVRKCRTSRVPHTLQFHVDCAKIKLKIFSSPSTCTFWIQRCVPHTV